MENLVWQALPQVLACVVRHRGRVLRLNLAFLGIDRVVLDSQARFLIAGDIFLARGRDIVVANHHREARLSGCVHDHLNRTVRLQEICPVWRVQDGECREEWRASEEAGIQKDVLCDVWHANKLGQIGYAFLPPNEAKLSRLKVPRCYDLGAIEDEQVRRSGDGVY